MDKIVGQTDLFNLDTTTDLEEEKLWIQTNCKPREEWESSIVNPAQNTLRELYANNPNCLRDQSMY